MTSLPELLMQMGPAWYATLALAGGCLWLVALRHVLRDLGRASPFRPEQTRCGLPKGPVSPSPLAEYIRRSPFHRRTPSGPAHCVSAPAPLLPQSRRETIALICVGQLLWLLAILTLAGVSPWSTSTLIAIGAGGAIGILAAGVLYARRFRR